MPSVERWRQISGFSGYMVSSEGRVRSYWTAHGWTRFASDPRMLKPGKLNKQGYLAVRLRTTTGKAKSVTVHRLVMRAFIGPCPDGMNVNHKDGDPRNNRLENLEYVTHSENVMHAYRTGLRRRTVGEASPTSKINWLIVSVMRSAAAQGQTKAVIARHFGVSESTVRSVVTGKSWRTPC